ncbi:MAG: O-antigen ligase [Bacteroidota bacterium]|nr:O-antigen ligase [Bacteroidota bacterium]
MKKKSTAKQKNIFSNPIFYFFSIAILLICNITYEALLSKSLEIRVFSLAIFLILLFTLPMFRKTNFLKKANFSILKNPFIIVYALWVILQGLGIFIAQNTGESLHEFLKTGSFLIFFIFLLLYVVPQKDSRTIFFKIMVLFTIFISFVGIVQSIKVFSEHGFAFTNVIKIKGVFSNKNMFSQILFFGFTSSVFNIYFLKKMWKRLAFFAALSSLLMIVLLMTRGVWLAIFVAAIISFVIYVIYIRKQVQSRFLLSRSLLLFAGVGLVSILIFGAVSLQFEYGQNVKSRIENSFKLSDTSILSRFKLWEKTTELIEENPVLGVGSGNWKIEILKYDVIKYYNGWIVPRRVHNDYLTVLSETGFVGFIVYLSLFGFILFYLISTIRKAENPDDKVLALALFAVTLGYLCFSFFSFPKERVETHILLNVIFAFSTYMYCQTRTRKTTKPNKIAFPILLIIALSFSSVTALSSWKRMQAEIAINKMYVKLNQNVSKSTIYPLIHDIRSPFVSISPRNTPFLALKAKFMYNLGESTDAVMNVYIDALKDSPYHVRSILEIADIYYSKGNLEETITYGQMAYQYAPSNEFVLLRLALYNEQVEMLDSSLYYLELVKPVCLQDSYNTQITRVLKKKAIVLLEKEEDQLLKIEIANLANANNGIDIRLVHQQAMDNHTSFEFEFLKQANAAYESKRQNANSK